MVAFHLHPLRRETLAAVYSKIEDIVDSFSSVNGAGNEMREQGRTDGLFVSYSPLFCIITMSRYGMRRKSEHTSIVSVIVFCDDFRRSSFCREKQRTGEELKSWSTSTLAMAWRYDAMR